MIKCYLELEGRLEVIWVRTLFLTHENGGNKVTTTPRVVFHVTFPKWKYKKNSNSFNKYKKQETTSIH